MSYKNNSTDSINSTTTKNVAFIINSLEGGGAERVMANALRIMQSYYEQQNTGVYLVLLDSTEESQQVPEYVNKITLNTQGSLVNGYKQLRTTLQSIAPEYCVSFLTRANYLTVLLAKKLKFKAIISERVNTSSHFSGGLKDTVSKLLIRLLYPKADKVIAVSEGVKNDLERNFGVPGNKIGVMYNPFNVPNLTVRAASPNPEAEALKPYIIGTGRLVKNKNFSLMLNAYAQSGLTQNLLILGKGELEDSLKAECRDLGIADKVHFLGFQQNPYSFLKHADFFVSTSNAEGFPNAIVEAMCLGKPVVVTNCESGPAEILTGDSDYTVESYQQCEFGMLCAVNNPEGVKHALVEMAKPHMIEHYQAKSAERSQQYSEDAFQRTLLAHINSVVATQ